MNIGIDARALTERKTGIGTYTYEIIKELNDIDNTNNYFLYSNKKISIDFKLNNNWSICEDKKKIGTWYIYHTLQKRIKDDKIDVFWGTQHCLPKRNKYTKNTKFVLTIHDLAIEKYKNIGSFYNTIIQKIILKKSCDNANKIIAVSESTKNDIIEILNINKEKIFVIYEGIKENKKISLTENEEKKYSKKFKLGNNKFIFFLSTIEPRKNLMTAIKAFEKYKSTNPNSELKFIISGGIGWKSKKVLRKIKKSNFSKDIILTGYITETEKEYFFKNCIAFIYPSIYEGFGIPILEAMQKGAIVITSKISSIPEVGGKSPLYLNNIYDEQELCKLIEKSINITEEEKKKIINIGYINVQKFKWSKCARETLELITEGNN